MIRWEYFTKLYDIKVNEGLHLDNKVRAEHVEYYNQKMKVKLGIQVFSASVADALDICKSDLQLSEFAESAPTIRFFIYE